MSPLDGRRWALNHARLLLRRELEPANRYFESFKLTADADICFIRFLKTLLDFQGTGLLSSAAERRIRDTFTAWPVSEPSTAASWPARHTENHDLMQLAIGMFAQAERGNDVSRMCVRSRSLSIGDSSADSSSGTRRATSSICRTRLSSSRTMLRPNRFEVTPTSSFR
jgi:hypothetical protein